MERIGPKDPPIVYLREWIERSGMTQARLADRMGTSDAQISRFLNGKRKITLEVLLNFANALDVAVERLYRPPPKTARDDLLDRLTQQEREAILDFAEFLVKKRAS